MMLKDRKKGLWKNRKGEDMLVDFWAILLFVIILLFFLILFIFTKGDSEENNKIREAFTARDTDYMLDSYIKGPYIMDTSRSIGEIIAEDSLNNDFSRTESSFLLFFNGANTTTNNDVGGYVILIKEGDSTVYKRILDLKNDEFEKKVLNAAFMDSITLPSGNIGMSMQLSQGNDPFPVKATGSRIIIPRSDGTDIEVILFMIYVREKLKIFE